MSDAECIPARHGRDAHARLRIQIVNFLATGDHVITMVGITCCTVVDD